MRGNVFKTELTSIYAVPSPFPLLQPRGGTDLSLSLSLFRSFARSVYTCVASTPGLMVLLEGRMNCPGGLLGCCCCCSLPPAPCPVPTVPPAIDGAWESCELASDSEPDWVELGLLEPVASRAAELVPVVGPPAAGGSPNPSRQFWLRVALYGGGAGVAAGLAVAGGGSCIGLGPRPCSVP